MATRSGSKTAHAHGCTKCRVRYEDDCTDPSVNGLCTGCKGHMPWIVLIENRLPKDCCRVFSREMKDIKERKQYSLAGSTAWFKCHECGRTQIYDPRVEKHDYNPGNSTR